MMEYWNVDFEKEKLNFERPSLQCQKDVKRRTK